ncbi:hypothetical protein HDU96_001369 [Phlyctochytrium bullatum]|nr:hypothetical protein HDU96_001369 [Phlyctochytrium bullatum]
MSIISTTFLLQKDSTRSEFLIWKRDLLVAINALKINKDYDRVTLLSEHLTTVVPTPTLQEYPLLDAQGNEVTQVVTRVVNGVRVPVVRNVNGIEEEVREVVYDVRLHRKELQRWAEAEGKVRAVVLERLGTERLKNAFISAGSVRDGLEALKIEINMTDEFEI